MAKTGDPAYMTWSPSEESGSHLFQKTRGTCPVTCRSYWTEVEGGQGKGGDTEQFRSPLSR